MTNDVISSSEEDLNKVDTDTTDEIKLISDEEFDEAVKNFSNMIIDQYSIFLENFLVKKIKPDTSSLTENEYQTIINSLDRGRDYKVGRTVKVVTLSNGMKVDVVVDIDTIVRFNHGKETDSWFD